MKKAFSERCKLYSTGDYTLEKEFFFVGLSLKKKKKKKSEV